MRGIAYCCIPFFLFIHSLNAFTRSSLTTTNAGCSPASINGGSIRSSSVLLFPAEKIAAFEVDDHLSVDTEELVIVLKIIYNIANLEKKHALIRGVFEHKITYSEGAFRTHSIEKGFELNALKAKENGLLFWSSPSMFGM